MRFYARMWKDGDPLPTRKLLVGNGDWVITLDGDDELCEFPIIVDPNDIYRYVKNWGIEIDKDSKSEIDKRELFDCPECEDL